jgi:hypothetical protein
MLIARKVHKIGVNPGQKPCGVAAWRRRLRCCPHLLRCMAAAARPQPAPAARAPAQRPAGLRGTSWRAARGRRPRTAVGARVRGRLAGRCCLWQAALGGGCRHQHRWRGPRWLWQCDWFEPPKPSKSRRPGSWRGRRHVAAAAAGRRACRRGRGSPRVPARPRVAARPNNHPACPFPQIHR